MLPVLLLAAGLLPVAPPAAAQAAREATGYVYHDRDGDRSRDVGEPGVADVLVSNGTEVVRTDGEGRYRLPVSDDVILFVVKPRGWMVPVDAHNLPRFYYIHKPGGSPDFEYAGVPPTGPLPASVDFPLYPQHEPDQFRALIFGDTQPYTLTQVDYVANDIVKELVGIEGVSFGITMGDVVGDDLDLFQPLNEAIGLIGLPWFNVYGNHDMNYDAEEDRLADETFERVYGPATYAFTYGRAHFILFDDVMYPSGIEGRSYVGGLREDQLAFVENFLAQLPKDDLVVLNMHIPIERERDTFRHTDRDRLFELLADHPNTLSLSAHTHLQQHVFFDRTAGWQQDAPHHHYNVGTTSGSWWNGMKSEVDVPHTMMRDGTPNGYAFLNIDGNQYTIDYQVAGRPATYKMNIYTPREVHRGADEAPMMFVNVFDGNEQTEVAFRTARTAAWQPMERVAAVDPYYLKLTERWNNFQQLNLDELWAQHPELSAEELPGSSLPQAVPSQHLWQAALPVDLAPGTYLVEVQVTDMFGRTYTDVHTFRVTATPHVEPRVGG